MTLTYFILYLIIKPVFKKDNKTYLVNNSFNYEALVTRTRKISNEIKKIACIIVSLHTINTHTKVCFLLAS